MWDLLIRDIRNQVASFLTERCTIQQQEMMQDEFGSSVAVYKDVQAAVPCRLIRADKPSLRDLGLQEMSRETYRLIVGPTVTLVTGQVVLVGDLQYEILGLRQHLTDSVFNEAIIGRLE